jgi:amino acid permease
MAETPEAPAPQQPDATPAKKKGSTRAIRAILIVLGIAALAVGFVYLSVVTGKLPSFMGKIPHGTTHRTKRGYAGVIVGAVFLLTAFFLALPKKQRS